MTLDIPTMYFVSVVTNVAMTVAVLFVALRQPIPGLKQLSWGLVANSGYYLVLGAHGRIPDVLSIGVGNMLGSLTLSLILMAVLCYRRARIAPASYILPVILMFAESLALLHDRESRLIIGALILCYQISLILWALLRAGDVNVGRGRTIMVVTLVVGLSTMAYRAMALGFGWHDVTPFQSRDSLNTIFYMINYLGMFFLAFGFVLSTVEQAAEQNRRFALEDTLTGLANRRAVFEALEKEYAQAVNSGLPLSLLVMDVDYFKRVNDRFGHQAGDAVLRHVAMVIRQRLRNQDIAGRFGGEEFLAVLPDTPPERGILVAEALRQTLAENPVVIDGEEIGVTISIGLFGSDRMVPELMPDVMIGMADEALYRAKENGRNRVEIVGGGIGELELVSLGN